MKRWGLPAILLLSLTGAVHAQEFRPCEDARRFPELNGTLCMTVAAPLRAPGPQTGKAADTVQLFVRKFPAAGAAKGTVWLLAGGPGESGAVFYAFISNLRASFPGFDLLIPDHRGTGFSTRLCPQEESVDSPGGAALEGAEWNSCWSSLNAAPDYARAFSITNAAHDTALLLDAARPIGPVYLYAWSYGTQLALRMMQVKQPQLAGLILDSLVPPEDAAEWDGSHRSQLTDRIGREVLQRCDQTPSCKARFAHDAASAMPAALAAQEQAAGLPPGDRKVFFGSLLDFPETRARIPELIEELPRGETHALDAVNASIAPLISLLERYPQSPSSIPLATVISVSENDARPDLTRKQVEQEETPLLFAAGLPGQLVEAGLPTYPRDRYFGRSPARLPPVLVLHGSLDPKTPIEGALAHAAQLRRAGPVTFVRATDSPHAVLLNAPACFAQAVQAFLAKRPAAAPACRTAEARSALGGWRPPGGG